MSSGIKKKKKEKREQATKKKVANELKLTGYQSIHPTEKFQRLLGGDKLPPQPALSAQDPPRSIRTWKNTLY